VKRKGILATMVGLALTLALVATIGSHSARGVARAQDPPPDGAALEAAPSQTLAGNAFTYQGYLTDGGSPANGFYDFSFSLYADAAGDQWVANASGGADIYVDDGLFTAVVDVSDPMYGDVYFYLNGDARYLRIGVRPGASTGAYTYLSPLQPLTPAPYALALPGLNTVQNTVSANVIGGYSWNYVDPFIVGATIGGGGHSGGRNEVYGDYATVGGGRINDARQNDDTVGGGASNTADGGDATVGGGEGNTAGDACAVVAGGCGNVAEGVLAAVGGGDVNYATAERATIAGGSGNSASGPFSSIGGGYSNYAAAGYATVPGGYDNTASGTFSFAAGRQARATYSGCFVWGDNSSANDVACYGPNRTVLRNAGGIWIYTNAALTAGVWLEAGDSSWNVVSDRSAKENFRPVDTHVLLVRLVEMPISTWNYKAQDPAIRHIGPMAQDFNALLPDLGGEGETYIDTLDADGVALAAVQGLYQLVIEQSARIDALEAEKASTAAEVSALQVRADQLEARLAALERGDSQAGASGTRMPAGWLLLPGLVLVAGVLVQQRRSGGGR
jgi:hypothetical protein